MALGTYSDLKNAIAGWLHRADLTSVIPTFIELAEADIRRDVRCRAMEATDSGSLTSATQALPSDFLQARRVILSDRVQTYVTPSVWHGIDEDTTDRYTILGTNLKFQASSGDYQLDYYAAFDALSEDGDTNWLLTNHPDVYLFGALQNAAGYVGKMQQAYEARYQRAIANLAAVEQRFGGPLAVRPEVFY